MRVGDLVTLSAYARKLKCRSMEVEGNFVGIITEVIKWGVVDMAWAGCEDYAVRWAADAQPQNRLNIKTYLRRELKYVK